MPHHSDLKLSLGMYEQLDCFLKIRNYGHALTNCVCVTTPKKISEYGASIIVASEAQQIYSGS